jgi:hypothetical protein
MKKKTGKERSEEMKDIIRESDIDKLSLEDQLEFYKKHFRFQHCERCSNELAWGWVVYECEVFCEDCFNNLTQEERFQAEQEIIQLRNRINELKGKFNLD